MIIQQKNALRAQTSAKVNVKQHTPDLREKNLDIANNLPKNVRGSSLAHVPSLHQVWIDLIPVLFA